MDSVKVAILVCFVALLGVPFLFRPAQPPPPADAARLIIITPHNEQIRYEFGRAFDEWHQRNFGQRVNVIYNVPGGTSEIRRMLEAQYRAALESGLPLGGDADLVFGGGSYEHSQFCRPLTVEVDGEVRQTTITQPTLFDQQWLDEVYGPNVIGNGRLYHPEGYWFGTALSGFGIVYNRDVLQQLNISEPNHWADLCHARLQGWVALVNPGQSGSIKTTFESILHRQGWHNGWAILRRAAANARYFSASSLKPPTDVSQGNAAMGMCIDFYGRFQAQALKDAGDADRIGYVDPPGGSTIDADPVSMLRGAPNPDLARRFILFCLSDEGQALWQFPRRSDQGQSADAAAESDAADNAKVRLGPERYELRRLPIVRSMYDRHFDRFIDQVNPYVFATAVENANPHARDLIVPIFAAMAMDTHHDLKAAWRAIVSHPAYDAAVQTAGGRFPTAAHTDDAVLREMLALFDALPSVAGPDGEKYSLEDESALGEIRRGWIRGEWAGHDLWHAESSPTETMRKQFGDFFRSNYGRIVQLAEESERSRLAAVGSWPGAES